MQTIGLLAAVTLLLLTAYVPPVWAGVTGKPRVIDGDTIEIGGERIRLHCIDAPEKAQTCQWPEKRIPCGKIAKAALQDLTAGAEVRCEVMGRDRYDRMIGRCFDANGSDINANMVWTGWALAFRKYSKVYVPQEDTAREAKRYVEG